MEMEPVSRRGLLAYALVFEGGLGVAACAVAWFAGYRIMDEFGWSALAALGGVLFTLPMLLMFAACLRWPVGPLASIKRFSDEIIAPLFRSSSLLDLAIISLLAGFGEELFFRGLVQRHLADWWGLPAGLMAASLLFGLLHPFTPSYVVLATLIGIYLGWTYQFTGNLLVPAMAHALYDFVALVVLCRKQPPSNPASTEA